MYSLRTNSDQKCWYSLNYDTYVWFIPEESWALVTKFVAKLRAKLILW